MITDALAVMPMSNPSSITRCDDLCIEPERHFVTMDFMPEDAADGERDSKIAARGGRSRHRAAVERMRGRRTGCTTGETVASRHGVSRQ
jgi:hypothetical protein